MFRPLPTAPRLSMEHNNAAADEPPRSNRATVLFRAREMRVVACDTPAPAPDQVLVRVQNVGICGSDVHYWHDGRCGPFTLTDPMVIGHESAGVVEAVGSAVSPAVLAPGDRVAMEPGVPCRRCDRCREGRYNLCPDVRFFATPPVDGSMARYVCHPADYCFKLPDGVSLEEGALCEPLSVGVHANNRAGVRVGSVVAVLGCGPIGLVSAMAARAYGASRVVVTDVSEARLQAARNLRCGGAVADATVLMSDELLRDEHAAAQAIVDALGGVHPNVTIDCCGFESSMRTALAVTANGGRVCLVGMGAAEVRVPLVAAAAREVDVLGVFRYRQTYPTCIALMASGKVDARALITHRYDGLHTESVLKAFEQARTGADGAIKVMFELA